MKRSLAWFLAVYVLFLTWQPCVDEEVICRDAQQIQAATPSDSQSDHQDTCSPFCTCSCCNISMEVTTPMAIPVITTIVNELTFCCNSQSGSVFTHSIWQPPKA